MKICFILEGCYPYVYGGVSTWVNQYILSKPECEFTLLTIGANKKDRHKFVYDIPKNVVEVQEIFLDEESENHKGKVTKYITSDTFIAEIRKLILGKKVDWKNIFEEVKNDNWNVNRFF